MILFGRHQSPVAPTVRTVMGIRGEPSTPQNPAKGLVWSAIVDQIDVPGSESDYVSVADTDRSRFASHPWSIGGGGAAELKDRLDEDSKSRLHALQDSTGYTGQTNVDEVMLVPRAQDFLRHDVEPRVIRPLAIGERIRDWSFSPLPETLFPYDPSLVDIAEIPGFEHWVWPFRTTMGNRATFAKLTYFEEGRPWWEWHQVALERLKAPLSIGFAFVATHNHFVLDRGGKVFKQSAPVIKLPEDATVDDHLALLGLLNSSTACFWMKQMFFAKGGDSVGQEGARIRKTWWDERFEFDGTKLQQFPLPPGEPPLDLATTLDSLATELAAHQPSAVCADGEPNRQLLDEARTQAQRIFSEMTTQQEELDWYCLHLYGLTEDRLIVPTGEVPPPLALGERAFEIVLARQVAAGEVETEWFARHRSTPITEFPAHWPDWYQGLVQQRINLIECDRDVALVERPENKRRWATDTWERREEEALRSWLLDRLESSSLWFEGSGNQERALCRSVAQLADKVTMDDPDFLDVARVWKGVVELDLVSVLQELLSDQHVPAQAAGRYKSKGLDKRRQWERTWDLQRMEDRGEPLPDSLARIPVPPKYGQADFAKPDFYKQRGKLDVPKERFASVLGAERDADPTMVLAWAGFDHAELAQSIGSLLIARQQQDGWDADRSWPLVVAMAELLPWLDQWHSEVDPRWGASPAGLYRGITEQQALMGNRSLADASEWRPIALTFGRKMKDDA